MTNNGKEFFVHVEEFHGEENTVQLRLYGLNRSIQVPCSSANYEYRFKLPKSQWICSPHGVLLYTHRTAEVQFRRGLHKDTVTILLRARERWDTVTLGFDTASYVYDTKPWSDVTKVFTRAKHPLSKGFLLSPQIAVVPDGRPDGKFRVYAGMARIGEAQWDNETLKYVLNIRDDFTEEVNDCLRKESVFMDKVGLQKLASIPASTNVFINPAKFIFDDYMVRAPEFLPQQPLMQILAGEIDGA